MISPRTVISRAQASLPGRAWQRYGQARGGVLAGGIAYVAFFSIFPALAVGFTGFGLIVGHDPGKQARVIRAVNDAVGTTIITVPHGRSGIVDIATLTGSDRLTIVGIVGLIGFLITGLGWLDALREGIRAMFGQPTLQSNPVKTKLRDLGVLITIGLLLLGSAIGGVVVSGAAGWLLHLVGLGRSPIGSLALGAASTLLLLMVDITAFMVIFRLLSGVRVPRQDLWDAALFGGIGLGVLKLLGGLLLSSAQHNKFLATAGALLGLLIWLNLVSRLALVAASWGATVAIDRGHLILTGDGLPHASTTVGRHPERVPRPPDQVPATGVLATAVPVTAVPANGIPANGVLKPGAPEPAAAFIPVVSPRQADRISIAAGAVLGAAGLFAARTAAGAVRTVVDSIRHPD